MSTKKLGRTILEGGRYKFSRKEGQEYTRKERAATRAVMSQLINDPESYEEANEAFPLRKPEEVAFTDKLSPVWRFLNSKDGQPWSEVKKEIAEKFDARSLAGYHIVSQHMLSEIKGGGSEETIWENEYYKYFIDEDNIFRKAPESTRYRRPERISKEQYAEAINWLQGRKVGMVGKELYWFMSTRGPMKVDYSYNYWVGGSGFSWTYTDNKLLNSRIKFHSIFSFAPTFRQQHALSKKDIESFHNLPALLQEHILKASPLNKGNK